MNTRWKIIVSSLVLILVLIWVASLIKCEILTHTYFTDFEFAYAQNTMLGDMAYFKVLSCNGKSACVYYVEQEMSAAHVLTFEHTDGQWVETSWNVIWSATGSASDVIYPYWWHFIYGGL